MTHREVIRDVVKRVEVQPTQVQVYFRLGPGPPDGMSTRIFCNILVALLKKEILRQNSEIMLQFCSHKWQCIDLLPDRYDIVPITLVVRHPDSDGRQAGFKPAPTLQNHCGEALGRV